MLGMVVEITMNVLVSMCVLVGVDLCFIVGHIRKANIIMSAFVTDLKPGLYGLQCRCAY